MKKDSYYFPHYYNARSDRKLMRVRRELGVEGYGIYFMILEALREQTKFSYPLKDIDLLADDFRTSEQKVRTVVCNYDLFQITEDEFFYSQKLIANLQPYIEKSERARIAAQKRWEKSKEAGCKSNANAMQMQCKSNADQNAKRGEEKRGEESILSEVSENKKPSFKKWSIEEFFEDVKKHGEGYSSEIKNEFYSYWTEPDPNNKMRFQLQRTWCTSRRLSTWNRNNK